MNLRVADLDDLLCIDGQSVALLGHRVVQLSELPTILLERHAEWHDVDSACRVALAALGEPDAEVDTRAIIDETIRELVSLGLVLEA